MTVDIAPIMGVQVGVEYISAEDADMEYNFLVINLFIVTILVTFN